MGIYELTFLSLSNMIQLQDKQEWTRKWNEILKTKTPQEIIEWSKSYQVFQLTSFGPSGLVILHMSQASIPLIFIDTLYHFPQTYALVQKIQDMLHPTLHIFKPHETRQDFELKYGEKLWEINSSKYDYLVKVMTC